MILSRPSSRSPNPSLHHPHPIPNLTSPTDATPDHLLPCHAPNHHHYHHLHASQLLIISRRPKHLADAGQPSLQLMKLPSINVCNSYFTWHPSIIKGGLQQQVFGFPPVPSMSPLATTLGLLLLGTLLCFFTSSIGRRLRPGKTSRKTPPGPPTIPVIGNLHNLGSLPHRSLQKLAKKYGPIMSIRLGFVPAVVVSTPAAAEKFLKTHDAIFASRPRGHVTDQMSYGRKGVVFTPYGPYWRSMRKLCALELMTSAKVGSSAGTRREEAGKLVESLKRASAERKAVDVSAAVWGLVENTVYRMVFGGGSYQRFDFNGIIYRISALAGAFNIADYVPWLSSFDLQGLKRRMKAESKVLDEILETILEEHEQETRSGPQKQAGKSHASFINVMLSLMNSKNNTASYGIDRSNIKAIVLDILGAGIDTSATTIDWTFSELLKHPESMKRLQEEIDRVVGRSRTVEEADLVNMPYLDMVVKEGFRLYPAVPMLLPHESLEDATVEGYHIARGSKIIVNAWAIHRDPEVWSEDAEEFRPERFAEKDVDLGGCDFRLIPFGSGRRGCPGMQLGLVTVRLVLAQLAHCFDWELPDGVSTSEMDMGESFGASMHRARHLLARPSPRLYI